MSDTQRDQHPVREVNSLDELVLHVLDNPRPVVAVTCAKACDAGLQMAGLLAELNVAYQGQVDFVLVPPASLPAMKAASPERLAHCIVLFRNGHPILQVDCQRDLQYTSQAIRHTLLRDHLGIAEPRP